LLLDLANSMRMCLSLPEAWRCGVGDSMRCLTGCLRRREGGDLRVVLHLSAGGFGVRFGGIAHKRNGRSSVLRAVLHFRSAGRAWFTKECPGCVMWDIGINFMNQHGVFKSSVPVEYVVEFSLCNVRWQA
jgi:hypothetical protein